MMDQLNYSTPLYIKKRGKYKKLTSDERMMLSNSIGRPVDGIWLVSEKGSSMSWIGTVTPPSRINFTIKAAIMSRRDELCNFIVDCRGKSISAFDIVDGLVGIISRRKEGGNKERRTR